MLIVVDSTEYVATLLLLSLLDVVGTSDDDVDVVTGADVVDRSDVGVGVLVVEGMLAVVGVKLGLGWT